MSSILVLCLDNTCLSKMAEAYLRFFTQGEYTIFSACLTAEHPIPMACLTALADDKLELDSVQTHDIRQFSGQTVDYLLTLGQRPDFVIPGDLHYHHHRHYQLDHATVTEEEKYPLVVEEVKCAVLHYIGSNLRTRIAS